MVHMIGNAHIDPVWLWRWQDGCAEIKATFRSALDRLSESGDFVFTAACASYYEWIEENEPDMFRKIRERVREGRWRIVGGMWVQPDCNMPSGESFARHLLYSQRYFREKFGVCVKTGYNVDSFGHSAMLPALLRRAGIENYVFLRPGTHENPDIPYPLFRWTAPDGSCVNAFRLADEAGGYGSGYDSLAGKIRSAMKTGDKAGYPIMCFYGVGNHGGGPTIRNIASIRAFRNEDPRGSEVVFSDPDSYFEEIRKLDPEIPEWKGELQHHASGCYSATSLIKSLNRRTENALIRCEMFSALSDRLTGHKSGGLGRAWKNLLFNQFHDILCGCCIREAYEDARVQLGEAMSIAAREENAALQKISWRIDTVQGVRERLRSKESHFALWELDGLGTPVVVFNPHPFEVNAPVVFYGGTAHAEDDAGNEVPVQVIRASRTNGMDKWDSLFMARVPALGYRLYWFYLDEKGRASHPGERPQRTPRDNDRELIAASGLEVSQVSIGNRHLSASFDPDTGALVSLRRKDSGRETLSGPALARLADIEHADTWGHMVFRFDKIKGSFGKADIQVLEEGPVRARLRVTTSFSCSTLRQDYILYADSDQLEVRAQLDMHEPFRMLKLCFPVAGTGLKAHAEIAYGVIERPNDGCEETGQRWMETGGEEGGLAILNDGKYSFSAGMGELRLTVANTSIYADHYGQETRDMYCVHGDMGIQEFAYALVPHDGSWTQAGLSHRAEVFNRDLVRVVETYHEGDFPARYEGLTVNDENVSVGALKRAEEGGAYVMRAVETMGKETDTVVRAPMFGRDIPLHFGPLEIKTVVIPDDAALPVRETLITEW